MDVYMTLLRREREAARALEEAKAANRRLTASLGLGGVQLLTTDAAALDTLVLLIHEARTSVEFRAPVTAPS